MTKEKLKEEWDRLVESMWKTTNINEAVDKTFDFFYSKLQEIREEDRRGLSNKIENLELKNPMNNPQQLKERIYALNPFKQLYLTWKTRKCRGDLTLYEYHIFRLYRIYVYNKLTN